MNYRIKFWIACSLAIMLVLLPVDGYGQKATEMFIPIGKSPGISGTVSLLGTIKSIDQNTYVLTIAGTDDQSTAVPISKRTKIYIDRSETGQSNTAGAWKDLKPGAVVEVKYQNKDKTGEVDWIKVKADN
jgi:hypothetical protein